MELLPEFTFERFIPTASASRAYRTCVAQLDRVVTSSGVLLLHGPRGTGKTHLLHAVGHAVRDRFPAARLMCTTAVDLSADLVDAARRDQCASLYRRYCGLDVLLIDDLHILAGKHATQRELAALLRRSAAGGACIFCASTIGPTGIDEFTSGLAVLPTYRHVVLRPASQPEMRYMIEVLAAAEQLMVPTSLVDLLARGCCGDVRRAVGAITQLKAAKYLPVAGEMLLGARRLACDPSDQSERRHT